MRSQCLGLLSFMLLVAVAITSCTAETTTDEQAFEDYFEQMGPPLERAADAIEAWTLTADEAADADLTSISVADFRELVENNLEVAREAQVAARDALAEVRVIVPPEECEEIHANLVESLRLSERGFLELVSYFQTGLRTGQPDEEQRIRGNELLADADRTKEQGLILMERTPECS